MSITMRQRLQTTVRTMPLKPGNPVQYLHFTKVADTVQNGDCNNHPWLRKKRKTCCMNHTATDDSQRCTKNEL